MPAQLYIKKIQEPTGTAERSKKHLSKKARLKHPVLKKL